MIRLSSYVAGRWFEGNGPGALLINPATEEVMAEANATGIDFGAVLDHARKLGGPALRQLTFKERAALLMTLSKLFHANREELLDLGQANGGGTRGDAKFDVDGAIGTLAAYSVFGEKLAERTGNRKSILDGEMFALTRSPRFVGQHLWTTRAGVAVHINAFNFPAWGTFEKLAVAWLAGVPVITKPATSTALLTWRMVQLMVESGKFPEGAIQLVCGSTGDLLDRLGPMDSLAFTGSATTGTMLRSNPNLLRNSVRVNVEADSLNALVLGPDVEVGSDLWSAALRLIVQDMTQKTGQKCTAIRRVLVPADRAEDLGEALVDALSGLKVGNPMAGGTLGPVATMSQQRDVLAGIATLASEGKLLCGGSSRVDGVDAPAGKGAYVAPTVILMNDGSAPGKVHDLEIFGPCVSLLPYDGSAGAAACILSMGQGSLVSTVVSDQRPWLEELVNGAASWLGRMLLLGSKIADSATPPGMVLPALVHGGPGRAGGGEELGGERGLCFYMQRTALQGDQVVLRKILGLEG